MSYTSNLGAVTARIEDARRAGLIAAAQVLVSDLKANRFRGGGYTSGKFRNTLNVGASITRSEPTITPSEGSIQVGTNIKQAVFWELGHMNRWTRKYERVERFMPSLRDNAEAMQAAYWRTVRRFLG